MDERAFRSKIRKSPAEILLGFFSFYRREFRPKQHIICVTSDSSGIENKQTAIGRLFHEQVIRNRDHERYVYTIRDPFNKTYNPARLHLDQQKKYESHYDKAE